MSQALSEEEFHRMQAQLLELRTQNYQLSDDLRKNTAELNAVRQKNVVLERDFVKTQKEVDALLSENEMLQGKLHSQEEDFRLQNSTLMAELSKLCTQIEQLEQENQCLKKEGGAASASSPPPNPASIPVDGELLRLQAENSTLQKKMKGLSEKSVEKIVAKQAALGWSAALCPITHCFGPELEMALNTEQEEKRLLKEQIHTLEVQMHTTNTQNTFALTYIRVSSTRIDEINQRKEEELKAMNIRVQRLQTDLMAANQIQTVKTQEMNLLREQQEALTGELQQRRTEQENLLAQRDDLNSQLQESSFANRKLLEQLTEEGQEKDRLLRELDEAKKTAEKRKAMLDEMAMQLNQEKSDHKEALSDLKLQHEKEVLAVRARYEKELRGLHEDKNRSEEEIRQQLRDEKARAKELEGLQPRVEELLSQVQSMEGAKGWFERRLKEAEVSISAERNPDLCLCVLQEKQSEMEKLKQQLVEVEKQREEHGDTIGKLKQVIAFEIVVVSGLEELVLSEINSPSRTQQTGDSSSVSSFSYKDMMKESQSTNQNKSGGGSPQSQRPAELSDDEVGELFQRLAEVQQEKWMLEEKVKHLEVSCSSMAEDICRKSAIIETYVMDSRRGHGGSQGDRGGLGSVLRELVKPGDENLREMNKKLQHMLEEQLTKNMHLQKDLELLSQELVRISKESSPGSSAAGSG
uniref:GRIP1 associated protein 1 n=1 Tax=Neolamprologus brichardi TaxID=32507 RepID=A0A3Q4GTP6_NEOBR